MRVLRVLREVREVLLGGFVLSTAEGSAAVTTVSFAASTVGLLSSFASSVLASETILRPTSIPLVADASNSFAVMDSTT